MPTSDSQYKIFDFQQLYKTWRVCVVCTTTQKLAWLLNFTHKFTSHAQKQHRSKQHDTKHENERFSFHFCFHIVPSPSWAACNTNQHTTCLTRLSRRGSWKARAPVKYQGIPLAHRWHSPCYKFGTCYMHEFAAWTAVLGQPILLGKCLLHW